MTRKKKRNLTNYVLVIVSVVFIVAAVLMLLLPSYVKNSVIDYGEYEISMKVGEYVGLNLDTDKIHFGTVPPGGMGTRGISITSLQGGYLYVTADGDFENIIVADLYPEKIEPNQKVEVMLYAFPPENVTDGNFTGAIRTYILKRKFLVSNFLSGEPLERVDPERVQERMPKVQLNIAYPNATVNNT